MEEITTIESDNQAILDQLKSLNENSVATTDSIKELQEYFIIQENRRQEAEIQSKTDAEVQKEASDLANEKARSEAQEQQVVYTELLSDGIAQLKLNNELQAVNGIYIGIVIGLLWMKILFDRLFK